MPSRPTSAASAWAKRTIAARVTPDSASGATGTPAVSEVTNSSRPQPAALRCGSAASARSTAGSRTVSSAARYSGSANADAGPTGGPAAVDHHHVQAAEVGGHLVHPAARRGRVP